MERCAWPLGLLCLCIIGASGQVRQYAPYHDPHCDGRQVIVHLFEWTWLDVAAECERFLGPKGFCGVQVSPPNEHCVISVGDDRPWWQRYQPVSYRLHSRGGSEVQFAQMVTRCRRAGVRVYVDVVLNHMAAEDMVGQGSGGSTFNAYKRHFPAVPFGAGDFHTRADCPSKSGEVDDYQDPKNVRNCNLDGLVDIDSSLDHVSSRQAQYLNHLVDLGVAGFRVDAGKHMWPADIAEIQAKTRDLPEGGRPMFYMEVIDRGDEPIKCEEYFHLGWVTEFRYGYKVRDGVDDLYRLRDVYDPGARMSPPDQAFVFVDNHDTQRTPDTLTYKEPARYKRAVAFTLAYNYGFTRVMSSYDFSHRDQGPPHNADLSTRRVATGLGGSCDNGWVCEHRWKPIANMVRFRTAVAGTDQVNHWSVDDHVLSFSRGDLGFFAMGLDTFTVTRQTGMPEGEYCDLISDCKVKVAVDETGSACITPADPNEPFVAIISESPMKNVTVPGSEWTLNAQRARERIYENLWLSHALFGALLLAYLLHTRSLD